MTVTIDGIPVYNATITDDETGMYKISLVDDPAVQSNFLAFDSNRKMLMYKVEDEEQRLVRGVVMRADFPIYRNDRRLGEYYIIYKAETIRQMAEKYLLESRQNNVNLMHEEDSDVEGVQMVQYFIKDVNAGVNPTGFEDIADGSLFAEFHIVNDDIWEQVKEGTYKGFSLEGLFDLVPEQNKEEVEEIVDALEGKFNKLFKKFNMSKFEKIKMAIARALVAEFANVTTDKGILAWDSEEDLKAGDNVYVEDADGNRTPAEDGDYKTEDGKTIKVADGKVAEIVDPEAEVDSDFGRKATDKGELLWDGEEDLKEGDAVYVEDENGERVAAPDGDYRTEDNKVIKVAEGKVAEIVDDEAEVAEEEAADDKSEVAAARMLKFAESYNEKERRIVDAIIASGKVAYDEDNYGYLIDAGDDFAVWCAYGEATGWADKFFRFPVTWMEDETAEVGEPVEVKTIFVPLDYLYPWNDEKEDLQAENEELKRQIAEMLNMPLAKPAHDVVTTSVETKMTGDKGLDRLSKMLRK